MFYGGGLGGFIATHDDEKFVMEYPSRLFGIAPTRVEGEYGFGDVAYDRTSFAVREEGKEWVGTAAALWGITAGVYLALMGPQGIVEIGESIISRARYAAVQLNKIDGVQAPVFQASHFKEFVVNFDQSGKKVAEMRCAQSDLCVHTHAEDDQNERPDEFRRQLTRQSLLHVQLH